MRRLGQAAGGVLIALGFVGLLLDAGLTDPVGWALWFGGILIAHDALLMPLVIAAGAALGMLAEPLRSPLRAGMIVAGLVVLAVLPTLLAVGRREDNPSILPLDYGAGLLVVLGVTAAACVLTAAAKAVASRVGRRT